MPLRLTRHACAGLLSLAFAVTAAPYVPGADTQVLERLPVKPGDPVARELRDLRASLAANPGDAERAGKLARRYFELSMAEGDPRYVGYAQAALRAWSGTPDALPRQLRIVRGMLRQYKHDFPGALADLAEAVSADPAQVEAHAWRAAIHMVQANYQQARADCLALQPHASELFATGCLAYVDATTGRIRAAYETLSATLQRHPEAPPETRLWNLTRLAEMAQRMGEPRTAENHFRTALSLDLTDNFLLAAYADFLLAENRPSEVIALLKNWVRSDTLLLRLALAEKALGLPAAAQHIQALDDRFAAGALRGEQLHLQEEARFRLQLKGDPAGALRVAAENWRTQREPRDATILVEAAVAARSPQSAQPALEWLEASRFEDPGLARLAAKLKAMSK